MKKTIIIIGVIALLGVGLLVYRRKKAANAAAELASKSEADQRAAYSANALKLANVMKSSADRPADIPVADKLINTINSGIMNTAELKSMSDAYLVYTNKYVGTQTKESIYNQEGSVLDKYQIKQDTPTLAINVGEKASTMVATNKPTGVYSFTGGRNARNHSWPT